jgi:hypothetical protein
MAVNSNISLSGVTEVTTVAPGPVGQRREEQNVTYGFRMVRMVKNTSAATIAAGSTVAFASGSSLNVALAGAAALKQTIAGITLVAIPVNYYGWVVYSGDCLAIADGAIAAANVRLRVVNATGLTPGRLDDNAAAVGEDEFFALALGTAAGAGNTLSVRVSGLV